tara:strand:- start:68 stop:277 length:210 start_codon:yes stop_codon:yes gene_type:complete
LLTATPTPVGIFETYVMLFCGKLIVLTLERISKYPAGGICVRAITFPIKERSRLNPVKIVVSLSNRRTL